MKREAATVAIVIFLVGLMGGGCNREAVPEPIDLEKVAAKVDAQISARQALLSGAVADGGEIDASSRVGITLLVEFIEVPKRLMNEYSAENLIRNDADEFRRQAQVWMKSNQARLFDMMMARCRNQQHAGFSSIRDVYYPGNYEVELDKSPEAKKAKADPKKKNSEETAPSPPKQVRVSAEFDVREIGAKLNFSPTIVGNQMIEIEVNPELSFRLDRNVWESKSGESSTQIETPVFHSVNVDSTVTIKNGGYAFLGAHSLPKEKQSAEFEGEETLLLLFARADSF